MDVLGADCDLIQSEVYKNSHFLGTRNDKVLYYDCSNYYFEIKQEDGSKKLKKEEKEWALNPEGFKRVSKLYTSKKLHQRLIITYSPKYALYQESLDTLKAMNFAEVQEQEFIPLYKRKPITDALHVACGFRTDYQFITKSKMNTIQKKSKGRE